jgi:hypothetical protein
MSKSAGKARQLFEHSFHLLKTPRTTGDDRYSRYVDKINRQVRLLVLTMQRVQAVAPAGIADHGIR